LLALDRAQEAQSYFQQAYAHLSQDPFLQKYEAPRLERLKALAQIN